MPRSQCASENVNFVQELAEVDGPFESPININFRDLTKLELPPLAWNRGDACPKKMKLTNTGHTVIISGKWKCERPYLTGGPLTGNYVFSQIHFHWGQDDCGGSEHLVCGDGFPLEMHVAHFKTDYLTQENALREKDGMVIVAYFFKLQDEPNRSLKKIIDLLPSLKQASTSHEIDPRPIISFCKPFTDDYFMYWGSVVTSTCAHILLWIICREPFGISKEQVMEFRKVLDSCQKPISKNSREVQPLHRRNVFHVNASKCLDQPLLPIRNIVGCYCKGSGENTQDIGSRNVCTCEKPKDIQDVEGISIDGFTGSDWWHHGGAKGLDMKMNIPNECFAKQTIYVQRATVSVLLKKFESEPVGVKACCVKSTEKTTVNFGAKSCCLFTPNPVKVRNIQKRKTPLVKRSFKNVSGFSQIMNSIEFLKNQTSKKLKEIDSINQEIKGMGTFCQPTEDMPWLGKIEKMIKKKNFNLKQSDQFGCFRELRKIAKDCNLKFLSDKSYLSFGDNNMIINWRTKENSKPQAKPSEVEDSLKYIYLEKDQMVSKNSQRLIENFFEDIQERDEEKFKKVLHVNSFCNKHDDSDAFSNATKGCITENTFLSGNFEDRFFQEVTAEDFEILERVVVPPQFMKAKIISREKNQDKKLEVKQEENYNRSDKQVISIHRGNYCHLHSKASMRTNDTLDTTQNNSMVCSAEENSENPLSKSSRIKNAETKLQSNEGCKNCRIVNPVQTKENSSNDRHSISNMSTESDEPHRMIIAKLREKPCIKDSWEQSFSEKNSYTQTSEKKSCKEIEGYYIHRKNIKHKKRKKPVNELQRQKSSSSKEDLKTVIKKLKWKGLRKAKFRLEIEKSSHSSSDLELENSTTNLKSKKSKLRKQIGLQWTNTDITNEDREVQLLQFPDEKEISDLKVHPGVDSNPKKEFKDSPVIISVPSSAESELNLIKQNELETPISPSKHENKIEIPQQVEVKQILQNKSMENLNKPKSTPEKLSPRSHGKPSSNKNESDILSKTEKSTTVPSNQICKSADDRQQSSLEVESDIQVLTRKRVDEELLSKDQMNDIKEKDKTIKLWDENKHTFLENKLTPTPTLQELVAEYPDLLNQTDSNKSFAIAASKGDGETDKLNNQASLSFLTLKMSSPSRPHSAETLSSTKQTFKRKSKKRPHCCKRNSRHHTRKNSSIFKKLNKTDNSIREDGQLSIISQNIQKYIQQKLSNQDNNVDHSKSCFLTILNISSAEKLMLTKTKSKKINPTQPEEMTPTKPKRAQQIPVRAVKSKEKNVQNLTKTKPLKSPLNSSERPASPSTTSPSTTSPNPQTKFSSTEKQEESNPEKPQPKKFKSKIPKKRVEKKEKIEKTENSTSKPLPSQKPPKLTPTKLPPKDKQISRTKTTTKTPEKKKITPAVPNYGRLSKRKSKPTLQDTPPPRGRSLQSSYPMMPSKPVWRNQTDRISKGPAKNLQKSMKITPPPPPTRLFLCENKRTFLPEVNPPFQPPNPPNDLKPSQDVSEVTVNKEVNVTQDSQIVCNSSEKMPSLINPVSSSCTLPSTTNENQTGEQDCNSGDKCARELEQKVSEKKFDLPTPCIPSSSDLLSRQPASGYVLDPHNVGLDGYPIEDVFDSSCPLPDENTNPLEDASVYDQQCLDSQNKTAVVMESTEMECISSCSKFLEESDGKGLNPKPSITATTEESKLINLVSQDRPEESNSDSSYEYKISITLNAFHPMEFSQNEKVVPEIAIPKLDLILQEAYSKEEKEEKQKNDKKEEKNEEEKKKEENEESEIEQEASEVEQDESIDEGKQNRRKRNDNEMSMEMKQKLIEIFEDEINKGIRFAVSLENLSETSTKLDDSDKTYSKSSVMTSCENLEILHQISDAMKEYLMDLKENGQLEKMLNKSLDDKKS